MRRLFAVVVVVIGAAIAVFVWVGRAPTTPAAAAARAAEPPAPKKPRLPPGPDGVHPTPPAEPILPQPPAEWRAALADRLRGKPHPGESAFRALTDWYVDQNLDLARDQAAHEGLTLDEVRELTHFGMLVLATQRVPEIEELVGRNLNDDEQRALATLMQTANQGFKTDMRALVQRGAPESDRWALIRATEADYQKRLFAITGLDEERLDDLLAGNLLLPGAPAATSTSELPSEPPLEAPRDTVVAPDKPR